MNVTDQISIEYQQTPRARISDFIYEKYVDWICIMFSPSIIDIQQLRLKPQYVECSILLKMKKKRKKKRGSSQFCGVLCISQCIHVIQENHNYSHGIFTSTPNWKFVGNKVLKQRFLFAFHIIMTDNCQNDHMHQFN